MMNTKTKRLLCALLAALLLSSCGTATQKDTADPGTETGGTTETAETQPAETEPAAPEIEAVNCNGEDYNILAREPVEGNYIFQFAELVGDLEGDSVDQATWERNQIIEGKYNLKLNPIYVDYLSMYDAINQVVTADSDDYDLVMPMMDAGIKAGVNGFLMDMSTVPHIDGTKPWWFSSIADDTSITGRNFFYASDINVSILDGVGAIFFNKDMTSNYQLDNPYALVTDGKWTYDKFYSMADAVADDTNGDGAESFEDITGLSISTFAWGPLFYGTGTKVISKDKDGMLSMDLSNERTITILQNLVTYLNSDYVYIVNQHQDQLQGYSLADATLQRFMQGRALFWLEIMYGMAPLRDMEDEFGVLPLPKYEEADSYATYVHVGHTSITAIPKTNDNFDLAGRILEDMAYQSSLSVRPAYYDVNLQSRNARDEESRVMLDMMYEGFRIDLAVPLSGSGCSIDGTMREQVLNNNTDIVSVFTAKKPEFEANLAAVMDAVKANP